MTSTSTRRLTRRAAMGTLMGLGFMAPAMARDVFSLGIGSFNTNDLKNIGKMLKGLSLSEQDEIAMGEAYFGPIIDVQGGAYANRSVQSSVQRFAAPLFETSTRTNFAWEITVLDNNEINAWALPGGKIAVNKGLLRYIDTDHELAAVIAHEMGHAELSHALSEMKKGSFVDGLSGVTQRTLVSELKGGASTAAGIGMGALAGPLTKLVTSGYARKSEFAADQHIHSVFQQTGHDVTKGAVFYQTLLETIPKKSKGTTSLFAGHPQTKKRLTALLEAAPDAQFQAVHTSPQDFKTLKKPFPTRRFFNRHTG